MTPYTQFLGTWSAVLLASQGSKIPSWSLCWSRPRFFASQKFEKSDTCDLELFFLFFPSKNHKTLREFSLARIIMLHHLRRTRFSQVCLSLGFFLKFHNLASWKPYISNSQVPSLENANSVLIFFQIKNSIRPLKL
jgi:hypothetical protein